jgi:co-chaperonin GroES (HSP10)
MSNLKPIGNYIIVKEIIEEQKTASGMILTGESMLDMRYRKGKVIKAGTDVTVIHEDDVIMFDKSNSFSMMLEGITVTIITIREVIVVL